MAETPWPGPATGWGSGRRGRDERRTTWGLPLRSRGEPATWAHARGRTAGALAEEAHRRDACAGTPTPAPLSLFSSPCLAVAKPATCLVSLSAVESVQCLLAESRRRHLPPRTRALLFKTKPAWPLGRHGGGGGRVSEPSALICRRRRVSPQMLHH